MPEHVAFYSLGRVRSSRFQRSATSSSGNSAGSGSSGWRQRGGTLCLPGDFGQITLAIDDARKSRELTLIQNGRDAACRPYRRNWSRSDIEVDAQPSTPMSAGIELAPSRVLNVTREGDRLYSRRPDGQIRGHGLGVDAFATDQATSLFSSGRQAKGDAIAVAGSGIRRRTRTWIGPRGPRPMQEDYARRMADVPDRFRDQIPQAGSKEVHSARDRGPQRGAPNYERMSRIAGIESPSSGGRAAGHDEYIGRGRIRSFSAASAPVAMTSMASSSPRGLRSFAP